MQQTNLHVRYSGLHNNVNSCNSISSQHTATPEESAQKYFLTAYKTSYIYLHRIELNCTVDTVVTFIFCGLSTFWHLWAGFPNFSTYISVGTDNVLTVRVAATLSLWYACIVTYLWWVSSFLYLTLFQMRLFDWSNWWISINQTGRSLSIWQRYSWGGTLAWLMAYRSLARQGQIHYTEFV